MEKDYLKLPCASGAKPMRQIDWYEGPLSGVCQYSEKKYFYTIVDELHDMGIERRYTLHHLPPDQLQEALTFENPHKEPYIDKYASNPAVFWTNFH